MFTSRNIETAKCFAVTNKYAAFHLFCFRLQLYLPSNTNELDLCFKYPNMTWPTADLQPRWSRLVNNERSTKLMPRTRDCPWTIAWGTLAYKVS